MSTSVLNGLLKISCHNPGHEPGLKALIEAGITPTELRRRVARKLRRAWERDQMARSATLPDGGISVVDLTDSP